MPETPSTDIRQALAAALNVIELAISLGAQHWDRTAPGPKRDQLWKELRKLMDHREEIEAQQLQADFASAEAQAALDALDAIAKENEEVASHLPTFTGWLSQASKLIGQAEKIVDELKKLPKV